MKSRILECDGYLHKLASHCLQLYTKKVDDEQMVRRLDQWLSMSAFHKSKLERKKVDGKFR